MKIKPSFKLTALATLLISTHAVAESDNLEQINVAGTNETTLTEDRQPLTVSAMKTTTGLTLSPKETPQSVSMVTKEHLNQRAIHNMEEALRTTTGITVIPESGIYRYQSRGFYIDQIEEDGIASTVRGSNANVYRDPQSMTDLAVYDHIEVVRGATGLTQANGEPGGTINAVRKRPTSEFMANVNLQMDTRQKMRSVGDVSGTIGPGVRGRLVSVLESDPTQRDLSHENNKRLIYGVMDAEIGSNSQLTLGALYQNTHTTPDNFGVPLSTSGKDLGFNRDIYFGSNWNREKARKLNLFAEFETFLGDDWKITHKIDYTKSNTTNQFGYALASTSNTYKGFSYGDPLRTNNLQRYDNEGDQITFQSNVTGKYSLFNRKHDLFFGYTFSREKNETRWRRVRDSTVYTLATFTRNSIAQPDWDTDYNDQTFYDRTIYTNAVSFGTRFNLSDDLHLLTGTRYTHWKRIGNTNYDWWNNRVDTDSDEHSHLTRNRFIPYVGLTYDIDRHNSLYVSYTSIFKPQSGLDADNKVLDPILGTNYEAGWKSDWFEGKLNTALALFQITQKNRPIWVDDNNYSAGGYYEPLGKVRSRGIDIEVSGNLTTDWQIALGYTFNRSKYLETESTRYVSGENFSKHTPKHIFRLYTDYVLPFDDKKWSVGLGVSAQSRTESVYGVKYAGRAVWDTNVRYQITRNVLLSVIGKNLTDKRYFEQSRTANYGINNFYGQERTFVFNLDWKF